MKLWLGWKSISAITFSKCWRALLVQQQCLGNVILVLSKASAKILWQSILFERCQIFYIWLILGATWNLRKINLKTMLKHSCPSHHGPDKVDIMLIYCGFMMWILDIVWWEWHSSHNSQLEKRNEFNIWWCNVTFSVIIMEKIFKLMTFLVFRLL